MEFSLEAAEVRVLGVLIEKQLSTPDYYPMTLNALATACNQKTNRDPVVSYTENEVMTAIDGLQRKRLAGTVSGSATRATKYRHACAEALALGPAERAVLCSLLLRGPETVGELRGRTGRMLPFDSLEAVEAALDALQQHAPPLVMQLPRRPGQKEARFAHLLSGEPTEQAGDAGHGGPGDEDRLAWLEEEVAALREQVQALQEAFGAFRKQFE